MLYETVRYSCPKQCWIRSGMAASSAPPSSLCAVLPSVVHSRVTSPRGAFDKLQHVKDGV